jgi:hypothetical protein
VLGASTQALTASVQKAIQAASSLVHEALDFEHSMLSASKSYSEERRQQLGDTVGRALVHCASVKHLADAFLAKAALPRAMASSSNGQLGPANGRGLMSRIAAMRTKAGTCSAAALDAELYQVLAEYTGAKCGETLGSGDTVSCITTSSFDSGHAALQSCAVSAQPSANEEENVEQYGAADAHFDTSGLRLSVDTAPFSLDTIVSGESSSPWSPGEAATAPMAAAAVLLGATRACQHALHLCMEDATTPSADWAVSAEKLCKGAEQLAAAALRFQQAYEGASFPAAHCGRQCLARHGAPSAEAQPWHGSADAAQQAHGSKQTARHSSRRAKGRR